MTVRHRLKGYEGCLVFEDAIGADDPIHAPKLSDRQLNLEEFFDGQLVAYGQFKDVLGNVSRRFVVDIQGTWDGETLTLVEDFVYEDDSTEQRDKVLVVGSGTGNDVAAAVRNGAREVHAVEIDPAILKFGHSPMTSADWKA